LFSISPSEAISEAVFENIGDNKMKILIKLVGGYEGESLTLGIKGDVSKHTNLIEVSTEE